MAIFTSTYAGLTLQDEDGVWAQFVDGRLDTGKDRSTAGKLRHRIKENGCDYIFEEKSEQPDASGEQADAGAPAADDANPHMGEEQS